MALTKIVVFSSGSGSTFQAIADACNTGELRASIVGLVTSRTQIPAIDRAQKLKIPYFPITQKEYGDLEGVDSALLTVLKQLNPQWVILAGYMRAIGPKVLKEYAQKIVNIHPSLLPKFGGPGMYGSHVHKAVIAAGESESGATVHLVTANYDEGPILAQTKIPIAPNSHWKDLEERVKAIEKPFYLKTLQDLIASSPD